MSGNFAFAERLKVLEGIVQSVDETDRGFYVKVGFEE
jgi:hypothetical protein